jgi:hypothetical protein
MKMSRLCRTKSEDEQQLQSPPVLIGPKQQTQRYKTSYLDIFV